MVRVSPHHVGNKLEMFLCEIGLTFEGDEMASYKPQPHLFRRTDSERMVWRKRTRPENNPAPPFRSKGGGEGYVQQGRMLSRVGQVGCKCPKCEAKQLVRLYSGGEWCYECGYREE